MKIIAKIFLVLCFLSELVFSQNNKPRFVVYASGDVGKEIVEALADEISEAMVKSGKYALIDNDRQFKESLKKGNLSDNRIKELAKREKADYLCFAKIKSVLGSNQVTAQLIDLKTDLDISRGMGKANGKISEYDDLAKISKKVVTEMLGGISDKMSFTFTDPRDGRIYKAWWGQGKRWFGEDLHYNGKSQYTWSEAKSACPSGWHLPTVIEWKSYIKSIASASGRARWWTATESSGIGAYAFSFNGKYWFEEGITRNSTLPVRCVHDKSWDDYD